METSIEDRPEVNRTIGRLSDRERMKELMVNSFSRNETISILPGFKDDTTNSKRNNRRTSIRVLGSPRNPTGILPDGATPSTGKSKTAKRHSTSITGGDGSGDSSAAAGDTYWPYGRSQKGKRESKVAYKLELERQIREKKLHEEREKQQDRKPATSSELKATDFENTGYLPSWFDPTKSTVFNSLQLQSDQPEEGASTTIQQVKVPPISSFAEQQEPKSLTSVEKAQNTPICGLEPDVLFLLPPPEGFNEPTEVSPQSPTTSIMIPHPELRQHDENITDATQQVQNEEEEAMPPALSILSLDGSTPHISQTADQLHTEEIIQTYFKSQLAIQIEERRRSQLEQHKREQEDEAKLERKIMEDQKRMAEEFEREQHEQQQRQEEAEKRQEKMLEEKKRFDREAQALKEQLKAQKRRSSSVSRANCVPTAEVPPQKPVISAIDEIVCVAALVGEKQAASEPLSSERSEGFQDQSQPETEFQMEPPKPRPLTAVIESSRGKYVPSQEGASITTTLAEGQARSELGPTITKQVEETCNSAFFEDDLSQSNLDFCSPVVSTKPRPVTAVIASSKYCQGVNSSSLSRQTEPFLMKLSIDTPMKSRSATFIKRQACRAATASNAAQLGTNQKFPSGAQSESARKTVDLLSHVRTTLLDEMQRVDLQLKRRNCNL